MTTSRLVNPIPVILKSSLAFLILLLISIIIHEFGHLLFALLLNIPVKSFTLFDSIYVAPVVVTEATENGIALKIIGYGGGLLSGGLYLTILIIKRKWFSRTFIRWILGCCLTTIGLWQFSIGIIEGSFHSMYVNDATSGSGISYFIAYLVAISGIALYSIMMPQPTITRTNKQRATRAPRIVRSTTALLQTEPDNTTG